MSYYGDLLAAFPELIKKYQLFTMEPQVGGGYKNRVNLFIKKAAFIKGSRSQIGIHGESRVLNEAGVFYCFELKKTEFVPQGVYFEYENEIFIIKDDMRFAEEAGFGAYGCQLVQGLTDRQSENMNVETRIVEDYPI